MAKGFSIPLSAVEGALIGESADSAPKETKRFSVEFALPVFMGAENVFTAYVQAIDIEEAKVAALDMLIRNVGFGEIKEVENG